jgi:CHAT domain-containing protein/tetratricopeptide (TPR) repeat protein
MRVRFGEDMEPELLGSEDETGVRDPRGVPSTPARARRSPDRRLGDRLSGSVARLSCTRYRASLVAALSCVVAHLAPSPASGADPGIEGLLLRERYVEAYEVAVGRLAESGRVHGPRHPETLDELSRVADIAFLIGDHDTSAALVLRLERDQREVLGERDPRLALTHLYLARAARYRGELRTARDHCRRGLALLDGDDRDERRLMAELKDQEGHAMRWLEPARSTGLLIEALELLRGSVESPNIRIAEQLTWIGWSLFHEGQRQRARSWLDRAEQELRDLGIEQHSLLGVIRTLRGDQLALEGHWAAAERAYREGLALLETSRDGHPPGFGREIMPLHGFDDLAVVQLKQGRGEPAWDSLQRLRNNFNYDFLVLSGWKEQAPASFREIRGLRQELAAIEAALRGASPEEEWDRLLRRLELQARLYRSEREYVRAHPPPPTTLARLQSALPEDTAYVGWVSSRMGNRRNRSTLPVLKSAWAYVVRDSGPIRWFPLMESTDWSSGFDRSVDEVFGAYIDTLSWPLRVDPDPELDAATRKLARIGFDPLLPALEGASTIVVEFNEYFPRVPLEVLPLPDGRRLGDRFTVSYVPSAAAYVLLDGKPPRTDQEPSLLAVGGAIYSKDSTGRRAPLDTRLDVIQLRKALDRDPRALDALPRLPFSDVEVEQIASMFPASRVLLGRDASEARLDALSRSARLADFDVIHIATHTLLGCEPTRSALALSRLDVDDRRSNDGLVEAREILLGWDLDADLLTLSGCQAARVCDRDGGSYAGFTQPLMGVGARHVVASLWKVDDRATALLMQRFYENLTGRHGGRRAERMAVGEALAEARRSVRDHRTAAGERPYAHPVYWAGFVLFGLPE